jgi:type I restriction enzyme, S subunit
VSVPMVRLGDVCEVNPRAPKNTNDDTVVSFIPMSAVSEDGHVSFEELRTYGEVKKGYTYFERGDVLVAKITPCFENGKAASTETIRNKLGFGSTEFHVLRPSADLDPKYLFYLIWSERFRKIGGKGMTGSAGQKRVPADLLRRLEIPLPPLDEQKRIAAILDMADALRAKRRQAIALLDSLTQSIFLEMFGDPVSNPKGWPSLRLSDAAEFFAGNSLPDGVEYEGQNGGYLLLKVSDLNRAENADRVTIAAAFSDRPGSRSGTAPAGAIVFPKRGGAIATNKKRTLARPAILDPNLMGVAPKSEHLNSSFLGAWFKFLDLASISSGSSVPQLNKQDLAPLGIRVPPLRLQEEFRERIHRLLEIVTPASFSLITSEQLFSSLQHRAFTGQL